MAVTLSECYVTLLWHCTCPADYGDDDDTFEDDDLDSVLHVTRFWCRAVF